MENKRKFMPALFAFLMMQAAFLSATPAKTKNRAPGEAYTRNYEVRITKVVDGDTVDVDFLEETPPGCDKFGQRVRLIGVDTPEYYKKVKQPYAEEAKEYTGRFLSERMTLRLDADTSYKDRYDRLLAYLCDKDGMMLNYDLIRYGYGRYYGKFKFRKPLMSSFKDAEEHARKNRLGLWAIEDKKR